MKKEQKPRVTPQDEQAMKAWGLQCANWGQFKAAFNPKDRQRTLNENPNIPDFTPFELPTGRLKQLWEPIETQRRQEQRQKDELESARREQWSETPKLIAESSQSAGLPALKDVAGAIRGNLRVELVTPDKTSSVQALGLLNFEVAKHEYERVGLAPPETLVQWTGGVSAVYNECDRVFLLRYTGDDIAARVPQGVVELKQGNAVGYHIQRPTKAIPDSFFQMVLEGKRAGKNSKELYSTFIHPIRTSWLKSSGCDPFDFYNMCDFLEQVPPGEGAVFLEYIDTHPLLAGIGLSEPFLKQVAAYDLDVRRVKYAFGYARMAELYRKYVPEGPERNRFEQIAPTGLRLWQEEQRGITTEDALFLAKYVVEGLSHTHEDVMEKRPDGLSVYSTVRFHERAGAEVIAAIPHCTKNDTESLCTGVLVVYDLQKLRQEGRI